MSKTGSNFEAKTIISFKNTRLKEIMEYNDAKQEFFIYLFEKKQLDKDEIWKIHCFNRYFLKKLLKKYKKWMV